jgi:competence protein ComEA
MEDAMSHEHPKPPPGSRFPPWLLRRADQAGVAAAVLVCLGMMAAWWVSQGGWRGRLVEVDRAEPQAAKFQVDINSAEWPELTQLPEVGETLARRIVQSRQDAGPFRDLDDLRRVRGIGPKTLETIRPYLRPMPSQAAVAGK